MPEEILAGLCKVLKGWVGEMLRISTAEKEHAPVLRPLELQDGRKTPAPTA